MNKKKMISDDGDSLFSNGKAERGNDGVYSGGCPLSPAVMATVTSISDTFLPAVDVPQHAAVDDDSVKLFFQTSASIAGTPQRVAWMISERLQHPKVILLRLALWLLSTRIGTLMLCGKASLSSQFPYLQSFPEISPHKRAEIVRSWSCCYIKILKTFYLGMKVMVLLSFFSQVNENNENISWKAIDYCGPDPDSNKKPAGKSKKWITREQHMTLSEEQKKGEEDVIPMNPELLLGPLHKGVINLNQEPRRQVFDRLQKLGFPVSPCIQQKGSGNPSFVIECDAVVVGSGSGGGVIAGVLANAGHKVLVLEKGKYFARSSLSLLEGSSLDEMYLGGGLVASKDMDILLLAGSNVGGGSTINWSASIQTPPHVLKEWDETHKLELFGSKEYRHAMETVCSRMGVQSEVEDEGFQNMVLRKGCLELGYPVETIPRNASRDHYCGWCSFGCKDGKKKGTSETWLADLVDSGNGVIFPECEAVKVVHNKKTGREQAAGVMFVYQNNGAKEFCFVKSRVTVIACGALCTPSLLKNSGLRNPNIGRNLHLHPVVFAWGYFPDAPGSKAWPEPEKKSYQGGIMTAMSKVVANFEESGYGALIQTPSLHPGMFSAIMPWLSGTDIKTRMQRFSRTAILFALARDKTSGEAPSPFSISYNMQKTDKVSLKNGLEKVLRILAAAGAEEIGTCHRAGKILKPKGASRDEIDEFVEKESSRDLGNLSTLIGSAHQMGSCRMGVDPRSSVVNPMGETWEVEGLFLADSSVFPTALGVNPMVTVQAIAYCTAQSVLKFLKTHNHMQGYIKGDSNF
ncbi:PREDICTED: long-chain-alcohol oxidase FAO4A-like [Ipomoea nil]|uniref:long-chain-alcohol oxidase FAO4A-like n=1 Tax=Ipomoea nil TaxID=35883 RepID=UPI00090193C2|nr:PREDICTED: long-chain-alcohol oxidase FAO4A-like [Ipomoea nil]